MLPDTWMLVRFPWFWATFPRVGHQWVTRGTADMSRLHGQAWVSPSSFVTPSSMHHGWHGHHLPLPTGSFHHLQHALNLPYPNLLLPLLTNTGCLPLPRIVSLGATSIHQLSVLRASLLSALTSSVLTLGFLPPSVSTTLSSSKYMPGHFAYTSSHTVGYVTYGIDPFCLVLLSACCDHWFKRITMNSSTSRGGGYMMLLRTMT